MHPPKTSKDCIILAPCLIIAPWIRESKKTLGGRADDL